MRQQPSPACFSGNGSTRKEKKLVMKKLFGTDGIRGKANLYPMTPETVAQLGRAIVWSLKENSRHVRIVIGKDTRISGDMIEAAMVSGICSMNGNPYLAGVIPTPGVAFLTASGGFDAGVMISASHNPYGDNGIKIFDAKGFKLPDPVEAKIEQCVLDNNASIFNEISTEKIGGIKLIDSPKLQYIRFLKKVLPPGYSFSGVRVVLDCANGATYQIAPEIFSELGADVDVFFAQPNGTNINDRCGSQHTESLRKYVAEKKADIGLAFDGDGDRLIAVDELGNTVTGDQILAVCAKFFKERGELKNNLVVSTVMSNVGLRIALKKMNIDHLMADVGDRYVLEQMLRHGSILGGEDSGHMIFLNDHTSGDGILTGIRLAHIIKESGKPLSELVKIVKIYPQVLMNIEVDKKPELESVPEISAIIKNIENQLKDQGRVLVRYSGTQPLCRVMVEGPVKAEVERYCREIVQMIDQKINTKH
jgi:phosphoglucosamine mutase